MRGLDTPCQTSRGSHDAPDSFGKGSSRVLGLRKEFPALRAPTYLVNPAYPGSNERKKLLCCSAFSSPAC